MGLKTPTFNGIDRVASIERLRERSKTQVQRLKNTTIRKIVDGLRAGTSLSEIVKQTRLSETEVLDIVAGLGTWLIHVHGSVPEGAVVKPTTKATSKKSPAKTKKVEVQLSLLGNPNNEPVPSGFEKRAPHRRDVVKSVGSIIYHNPDNVEITRWLDRRYMSTSGVLTGADVATLFLVAQLGRLSEMGSLTPSPAASQAIVGAFDLFSVSISDARDGVKELAEMGTAKQPIDTEKIKHNVAKMAWLDESRARRLLTLAEQAEEFGDRASQEALEQNLRSFAREASRTELNPTSIAALRRSQVLRLIERAGLAKSEDLKRTESSIRNKLIEMGLRDDLDRLLSDAMRAVHAKCESEFWKALEARKAGDSDWRARLQKSIAAKTKEAELVG